MNAAHAIEARHVSFAYERPVLEDFSVALPVGCVTGLIGPNGCGKTTALMVLDGVLKPLSGEVILGGGRALAGLRRKDVARMVAVVPQNAAVAQYQTVFEFALQGRSPHLSLLGFETEEDERIAAAALEMTGLVTFGDIQVSEISGGERQRLLLARALAQQPRILLLDEFTANLDIKYQVELMHLVTRLTRERGLATLVVSHEIHLLAGFADRIVLMSRGRVLQQGNVREVVTPANLKSLFGVDFAVRPLPGGSAEIVADLRRDKTQ